MQAGIIITRARNTLIDPAPGTYWTDAELIDYLNGGITFVVGLKPDAYVITGPIPLVAGINQSLPSGGVQALQGLINVASNKGILTRNLEKFTHANTAWATATPAVDVNYFFPDNRDPTRFRVSPPNTGAGSMLAMYCAVPTPIAVTTDVIPISDVYQTALWAFVVGSAFAKNSSKQDLPKTQQFMTMVAALVTGKNQAQAQDTPPTAIPDLTV